MKKWLVLISALLIMTTLTGCATLPLAALSSMVDSGSETVLHADTQQPSVGSDQVVISRAEYERYQKFDELIEIMDIVDTYYYKDVDETKMLQGASAGLLDAIGDPYTFYYTPEDYATMWEDDKGEYVGVGIQISASYETQICTITRVFDGGPAQQAGVQKGDILYRVGEDLMVTADTLQDAVNIMRGTPGTQVDVTFLRNGEPYTVTMTRAAVNVTRIDSMMLDERTGYIYLYEFAGDCSTEFEAAVRTLTGQGAKGIIIDLRDNGGGWVSDAQAIADIFLDEGVLCYLEYKNGERQYYYTRSGATDVQLVILVNQYTASSSEILTGCLKDRTDATVVGVKSFGKGIVQSVLPVGSNGAGLQVTQAAYFTPNGNAVHEIGITPDVVVEMPEDAKPMYLFGDMEDPQLKRAYEIMQIKLDGGELPVTAPETPEETVEEGEAA